MPARTISAAIPISAMPRSRPSMRSLPADRVAILDVDYHHGNGTQDIFYDRADVALCLDPCGPGDRLSLLTGATPTRPDPATAKARRSTCHCRAEPTGRGYDPALAQALDWIEQARAGPADRLLRCGHLRSRSDQPLQAEDRRLCADGPPHRIARTADRDRHGRRLCGRGARGERGGVPQRAL